VGDTCRLSPVRHGAADIQVPVAKGGVLAAAQPEATGFVIEGMTHVFKTAQGQNAASTDPTVPLAEGFVDAAVAAVAP